MPGAGEPVEYPLLKGTDFPPVPQYVTLGQDGYLWVTTDNSRLVQVNRASPASQLPTGNDVPIPSAGIVPDPRALRTDGRKSVWIASPSYAEYPIIQYDIVNQKVLTQFTLDSEPLPQTLTRLMTYTETRDPRPVCIPTGSYSPNPCTP
ncbi:hypothetical protein GCM10010218_15450 [Streptomyces mashuensis]|uniref:Uncharacterized protein n=1 Tax=Streptomyces mashuensis TaxID=33904 RepID=A0A919EBS2_9ACTN|nr:hypothetical protein [Streptomyces mashuensis]GHF35171.1 hypothetical protein GCM10010218_15450 [Streptomyces mashuensis]